MVINFRPISFHCSSTACEGLGAGFGGAFFAASCANAGNTANPMAKARPATHLSFFIFPSLRYAQKPDVHSSDAPPSKAFPLTSIDSPKHPWPPRGVHLTQ